MKSQLDGLECIRLVQSSSIDARHDAMILCPPRPTSAARPPLLRFQSEDVTNKFITALLLFWYIILDVKLTETLARWRSRGGSRRHQLAQHRPITTFIHLGKFN